MKLLALSSLALVLSASLSLNQDLLDRCPNAVLDRSLNQPVLEVLEEGLSLDLLKNAELGLMTKLGGLALNGFDGALIELSLVLPSLADDLLV